MSEFLRQLHVVALSPLAFVAYIALIVAWLVLGSRVIRNRNLLKSLKDLPEKERTEALRNEMGVVLPKDISAGQWLRSRVYFYYFLAFITICFGVVIVIAIVYNPASSKAEESKETEFMLTVRSGETGKAFNDELFITLIQTTPDGSLRTYKASVTAMSPGYPSRTFENKEVGSIITYDGKSKYQIQILEADESKVRLSVKRE